MSRSCFVAAMATALLPMAGAQEVIRGGVPRGGPVEVIHALFVQAQIMSDGRVLFCVPLPDKPPDLYAAVDGKEVRAIGVDHKPLAKAELQKRLQGWTGVVVVQAEFELPDPFFLKVLNEKSVVFVLPKKLFEPMAKASASRRKPGEIAP